MEKKKDEIQIILEALYTGKITKEYLEIAKDSKMYQALFSSRFPSDCHHSISAKNLSHRFHLTL